MKARAGVSSRKEELNGRIRCMLTLAPVFVGLPALKIPREMERRRPEAFGKTGMNREPVTAGGIVGFGPFGFGIPPGGGPVDAATVSGTGRTADEDLGSPAG